jgi:uncharacterized phage-associated protein/DNA-binding Xre family transcriptional regulator
MSNAKKFQEIISSPQFASAIAKRTEEIEVALKIKKLRLELGLTQLELAEKMGVTQTVISRIESLEGGITTGTIAKFCKATGLELDFIKPSDSISIFEIANYILGQGEKLLGDNFDISNLKINKLLFFIDRDLFDKLGFRYFNFTLQAWEHGPVYPDLYHRYKGFGRDSIKESILQITLPESIKKIIDKCLNKFINLSAKELELETHKLDIWKNAISKGRNTEIEF